MINFETLKRRLQAIFSTGKVKQINDSPPDKDGIPSLQEIQFESLDGELRDKRENYTPYGFTHWPVKDKAEALLLAENGEKAHTIAICIADRWHRLELEAEGEVAIFDDQGQYVWLKRSGIKIKAKGLEVDVDGDMKINGGLKANGRKLA